MKIRNTGLIILAALSLSGCVETIQQRMISELEEADKGFDATKQYKEYLNNHGKDAKKLRETAAQAANIQIHLHFYRKGEENGEIISLTEDEVKAVKEILAEIQQTPPNSFDMWLELEHFSQFVQFSASSCWSVMEFVSADGAVLHTFQFNQMIGSTDREEEYKTAKGNKPYYMLPDASVKRWNDLHFHQRAENRLYQLRSEIE